MLALLQRVKKASVSVNGQIISKIDKGLLVLLGVVEGDTEKDADYIAQKLVNLRVFQGEDSGQSFCHSIKEIKGEILLVSQFTLAGDCKKGRRPSFTKALNPKEAEVLYEYTAEKLASDVNTKLGLFGADMDVELINDGPVTLLIDSKE